MFPNGLLIVTGISAFSVLPISRYQHSFRLLLMAILGATLLLAVRLHSLRAFFAISALIAQLVFLNFGPTVASAASLSLVVIAVDFALVLMVDDAFFDWEAVLWWAGFLAMQWTTLTVALRWASLSLIQLAGIKLTLPLASLSIVQAVVLLTTVLLLGRFLYSPDAVSAGLAWSTAALFAAVTNLANLNAYLALSALAMAISVIERSHWIAYHDELTGLPGRRAFNEALAALGHYYSIAIVDVDFFKKFNDSFGHETGDDVLRKVAAHLSRVNGGMAYRCGGEEFAIIFPNSGLKDAACYTEEMRFSIEQDTFVVRGPNRSTRKREERRAAGKRGKHPASVRTGVTVSVGVAESAGNTRDPADVIGAADKALYRAKHLGRNRVECSVPPSAKAAAARRLEEESRTPATPAPIHR